LQHLFPLILTITLGRRCKKDNRVMNTLDVVRVWVRILSGHCLALPIELTREAPLRCTRPEILRQQYTFSPPVTTREAELHEVELAGVRLLELSSKPELQGGEACASLACVRLA
jgi:hypothetical protein